MHMYHGISRVAASMCFGIPCVFESGCNVFVAYFGAYYGLLQYYINMQARIHKQKQPQHWPSN